MRSISTFLPLLALAVLLLASETPADAQSSDAALSGLTMAGSSDGTNYSAVTLSPVFAAGTGSYIAVVADTVTTVKVTPTAIHAGATVRVGIGTDLTAVASGSASHAINLSTGTNVIKVEVTAQDGTTAKNYTIIVATIDAQLAGFVVQQNPAATPATYDCTHGITQQQLVDAIREYINGDMTVAMLVQIIRCYLFGPTPPSITVSGLDGSMGVGDSDTFTVSVEGLSSSYSYDIRVEAGSGLAFNSACTERYYNHVVPNGAKSATVMPVVYACSPGSHEVRAKIRSGTTVINEDSQTVTVTATDVNERPSVDSPIADQTMTAGVYRIISLQGRFSDPDGDTLTYTASSSATGVATASVSGSTLTLTAVAAGSATITVTAADRAAGNRHRLTASQDFKVTVEALPTITIAASTNSVGEGQFVPFRLSADPAPTSALKVKVSVTETGSFLSDTPPTEVTIAAGSDTASLTLRTTNDMIDEENGIVTVTVNSGTGYNVVGSPAASVTVRDDDPPPVPTGLRANGNIVNGEVSIWWEISTGATAYDLQIRRGNMHRHSAEGGINVHTRSVDQRHWNHRDQYETQRWHWQHRKARTFCRLSATGPCHK